MSYLGIDLGTSGLRALLVDEQGAVVGSAERHYMATHPQTGWSEQNPADWVDALEQAVDELRQRHPIFSTLKGIGVAGQMHGATLLDHNDEVIRPCILWNDTRAHIEAAELDRQAGVRALSGNIVFPGFTAPKLKWLQAHEPESFGKIARVLLPAGFLNFYLTGQAVADVSDSAGTAWLDIAQRCWSSLLLELCDMRPDQMPELVEGSSPAGELRPALLEKWGLDAPVVIAGGAGDNAAAACGIGALNDGQGFVSLGTSGVLLIARDGCQSAAETAVHTFCHAVPDRWYQMGVMLSATASLNWLSAITGQSAAGLTAALGNDLAEPGKIRFLPYLAGERTPHNDARVRGGFFGLAASTTQSDLTRAVLEGVAFGLRDNLEALRSAGADVTALTAIGGGSASRYWLELIATVLKVPLRLPKDGESGAAMGAARLARLATTGEKPEEVLTPPPVSETLEPQSDRVDAYEQGYQAFRQAYPVIRQLGQQTGTIDHRG